MVMIMVVAAAFLAVLMMMLMVVTAAADCKLLLNHYGGRSIELVISPDIKTADLQLKAGTEIKIGYTIEFKKPE